MLFDSGVGFHFASSFVRSSTVFNNRVNRNSAFSLRMEDCSDIGLHRVVYSQHSFNAVFSSFLSEQPQSDSTTISSFLSEQPQSVFLSSFILFSPTILISGRNIMYSITKQNQYLYFS